ncbi:MAG TPA: DUF2277 domain-containing protein [Stackebrandtia sp.]|jgi:hypothetical protein|uniref:DUF2277 domain-containing protein n=1 Tax=Stackebrandtia sp. TaxID=2023065 RepID=UPI002D6214D6|nr:DUF2277 domain-containing protein [Stackebrandtia sp.]HZE40824.1 DUF2277 domain-containing protein [Stackebrandtia sp.]
MCRNIRRLNNLAPPATAEEIRDAAVQYVRKLSGAPKPSQANQAAFDAAVDAVAAASATLLESLTTTAPPRTREQERERAAARSAARFG